MKKSELTAQIKDAVWLLQNATEDESFRVKIVQTETGDLAHYVEQRNTRTLGHLEIVSFPYLAPDYNTEQDLLDDSGFDGTIQEWDWDNFVCGNDFYNYCDRIFEDAIENCMIMGIEIEE